MQKWQRNAQKTVMQVQSCCFAYQTHCFIDVLVAVLFQVPNDSCETRGSDAI